MFHSCNMFIPIIFITSFIITKVADKFQTTIIFSFWHNVIIYIIIYLNYFIVLRFIAKSYHFNDNLAKSRKINFVFFLHIRWWVQIFATFAIFMLPFVTI